MRRTTVVLVLILLALWSVGCSSQSSADNSAKNESIATPNNQASISANETPEANNENAADTSSGNAAGTNTGSAIIAKSNNAVSGKDKEAVLKKLDDELDSLFSNIDSMDDVQESDLQTD